MNSLSPLQSALCAYNIHLFGGRIRNCIVLARVLPGRSTGFYTRSRYLTKTMPRRHIDEIVLHPHYFQWPEYALSVLVHEMCHAYQSHYGAHSAVPPIHNAEFARIMIRVGLMPSQTGQPGGSPVGATMDQYIIPGGGFSRVTRALLNAGLKLPV